MVGGSRGNGIGEGVEGATEMKEGNRVELEQKGTAKRGEEGSEVVEEPEMRQRRIRELP
jgi:hypothetical protein